MSLDPNQIASIQDWILAGNCHVHIMWFWCWKLTLQCTNGILWPLFLLIQQITLERTIYCQWDDSCRKCMSGKWSPQFADCCGTCGDEDSVSFSNLSKFLAVLCDNDVWFLTSKWLDIILTVCCIFLWHIWVYCFTIFKVN